MHVSPFMQAGTAIQALIVLTVCLVVESFEAAGSASNHLVRVSGGLLLNDPEGMSHARHPCFREDLQSWGAMPRKVPKNTPLTDWSSRSVCCCLGLAAIATVCVNVQDISPKYAGIIYGLTNGFSSIVEALSIYGTGVILDSTHSWPLVFRIVASLHVLGGTTYLILASTKRQFE